MKKIFFFFFFLLIAFTDSMFSQGFSHGAKLGITAQPSSFGPGLGVRYWTNSAFGWGAEAEPSWAFNDVIARGRLMLAFSKGDESVLYALATLGYTAMNENLAGTDFSFEFPSFAVGLGYEWLYGDEMNYGFGLEVGYQIGSAEYEYKTPSYTIGGLTYGGNMKGTFELPALYVGASLAIYF